MQTATNLSRWRGDWKKYDIPKEEKFKNRSEKDLDRFRAPELFWLTLCG